MGHGRRRHGHFWRRVRAGLGLEIFEILHLDAAGRPHHPVDDFDRQRHLFLAALLRLLALQDGAADREIGLDPADPVDEVEMEALAPEFAVSDGGEADRLLFLHHVRDGGVFASAKFVRAQRLVLPSLARFQQRLRAQQAADMVGAKRCFHRNSSLGGKASGSYRSPPSRSSAAAGVAGFGRRAALRYAPDFIRGYSG